MLTSTERIARAVTELTGAEGVFFDAKSLVQDVVGASAVFPEFDEFEAAIAATKRMLGPIVAGKVDVSRLSDDYEGWECCHYQPRMQQGTRATMRIMFSRANGTVRVRGFGDRSLPEDFYHRMADISRIYLE